MAEGLVLLSWDIRSTIGGLDQVCCHWGPVDGGSRSERNGAVCEAIYGVHASEGWHHTANSNRGADSIIFAYGQQLENLVTDFDGAWYSESDGSEVGSACIGDTFSELDTNWNVQLGNKYFLLPKLWQPAVGCKLSLS